MLQAKAFGPAVGGGRKWTKTEERFMGRFYPGYDSWWIARQLSRTDNSIQAKAGRMGLRKKGSRLVSLYHYGAPDAFAKMIRKKR